MGPKRRRRALRKKLDDQDDQKRTTPARLCKQHPFICDLKATEKQSETSSDKNMNEEDDTVALEDNAEEDISDEIMFKNNADADKCNETIFVNPKQDIVENKIIVENNADRGKCTETIFENPKHDGVENEIIVENIADGDKYNETILENLKQDGVENEMIVKNNADGGKCNETIFENPKQDGVENEKIIENNADGGKCNETIFENPKQDGVENEMIVKNNADGDKCNKTIFENPKQDGVENEMIVENNADGGKCNETIFENPKQDSLDEMIVENNAEEIEKLDDKNYQKRTEPARLDQQLGPLCLYCENVGHLTPSCEGFLAKRPQGRWNIVRQRRWCFYCFATHRQIDCVDRPPCGKCGGPHHQVLCLISCSAGLRDGNATEEQSERSYKNMSEEEAPVDKAEDGLSDEIMFENNADEGKICIETIFENPKEDDGEGNEMIVQNNAKQIKILEDKDNQKRTKPARLDQQPGPLCLYCRKIGHLTPSCEGFLAKRTQGRCNIVRQRRWCYLCLKTHRQVDCTDRSPCPMCGGPHHQVLCLNQYGAGRRDGNATEEQSERSPGKNMNEEDDTLTPEDKAEEGLSDEIMFKNNAKAIEIPEDKDHHKRTEPARFDQQPGPLCLYCKKVGHLTPSCEDFLAKRPRGRWTIVVKRQWCFYCLEAHHQLDCADRLPCGKCGGPHHRVLCKEKVNVKPNQLESKVFHDKSAVYICQPDIIEPQSDDKHLEELLDDLLDTHWESISPKPFEECEPRDISSMVENISPGPFEESEPRDTTSVVAATVDLTDECTHIYIAGFPAHWNGHKVKNFITEKDDIDDQLQNDDFFSVIMIRDRTTNEYTGEVLLKFKSDDDCQFAFNELENLKYKKKKLDVQLDFGNAKAKQLKRNKRGFLDLPKDRPLPKEKLIEKKIEKSKDCPRKPVRIKKGADLSLYDQPNNSGTKLVESMDTSTASIEPPEPCRNLFMSRFPPFLAPLGVKEYLCEQNCKLKRLCFDVIPIKSRRTMKPNGEFVCQFDSNYDCKIAYRKLINLKYKNCKITVEYDIGNVKAKKVKANHGYLDDPISESTSSAEAQTLKRTRNESIKSKPSVNEAKKAKTVVKNKSEEHEKIYRSMPPANLTNDTYGLRPAYLIGLGLAPPLTNTIIVTNLDKKVTSEKLREVFSLAGKVTHSIYTASKNEGSVAFDHPVEVVQAIAMFNNRLLYGKEMKVVMDTNNYRRLLPEGLMNIGPGLGCQGEPLRSVRAIVQMQPIKKELEEIGRIVYTKPCNQAGPVTNPVTYANQSIDAQNSFNAMNTANPWINGQITMAAGQYEQQGSNFVNPPSQNVLLTYDNTNIGGRFNQSIDAQNSFNAMNTANPWINGQTTMAAGHYEQQGSNVVNPPSQNVWLTYDNATEGGRIPTGPVTQHQSPLIPREMELIRIRDLENIPANNSGMVIFNNLPPSMTEQRLNMKMRGIGELIFGEITAPGRAIVRFMHPLDADRCIKIFHRSEVDGHIVDVNFF